MARRSMCWPTRPTSDGVAAVGTGACACCGGVLALHLLALAREHRAAATRTRTRRSWRRRARPARAPPMSLPAQRTARCPGAGHVDNRIVGPVGHAAAAAPGGREPGRPRVREAPDASLPSNSVRADERRLERRGRAQLPELVGASRRGRDRTAGAARPRWARRCSGSASGGVSRRRKRVGPRLLGGQRGVIGDGERFAEELVGEQSVAALGPVVAHIGREVGGILVARRHSHEHDSISLSRGSARRNRALTEPPTTGRRGPEGRAGRSSWLGEPHCVTVGVSLSSPPSSRRPAWRRCRPSRCGSPTRRP